MAYTITKTNGITLGVILDGTADTATTSLTLVGRNYSNYGQIMTNNLVELLENFAYNISPSNPLAGQLWWDTGTSKLNVYTGTAFKIISSVTSQPTAPIAPVIGDLWLDTTNTQVYIYVGTGWILVGPGYSAVNGKSGAIWEIIVDTAAGSHQVVSIYLNNVRTAIISQDNGAFTPLVAIAGFTTIQFGYNLSSVNTFYGNVSNAISLGSIVAANYVRTDISNTLVGNLRIINNAGITIGTGLDLSITNNSIINNISNANTTFYSSIAGVSTATIAISGSTGIVTIAGAIVATQPYVDAKFTNTALYGVPVAPTATVGVNTTQLATTAFVQSAFDRNKISQLNSDFTITDTGTGTATLTIDGNSVMSATVTGVSLSNGSVAVIQPQVQSSTGNAAIATTSYVRTATTWWGGSAKFVSTSAPDNAQGVDGDFWFTREA